MKTKRLNLLDMAWLNVESARTPMHVGGLLTFKLPDDAPHDFCHRLLEEWGQYRRAYSPWNHRLRGLGLKHMAPEWELLDEIDVDYHLRQSALPAPGGELELGTLASRLHSHPLDLSRPPWECHVIEGLENNRFAIYIKMHHSLIDGVSGMRLLARALATEPGDLGRPPFWAIQPRRHRRKAPHEAKPGLYRAVAELAGEAREQVSSLAGLAGVLRDMLWAARSRNTSMSVPFSSPASSILNARIDGQRRYATQLYSLAELKEVAAAAGVTVNDIVLAICGGALRRYLRGLGELPKKSLTAGIPVSVRPADDEECGNAITFIIASLATDIEDARKRLEAIAASTQSAKHSLQKLPASAITQYTIGLMAPYILSLVTGMGGRTRPVFNVTVSNVPGPKEPLYLRGARMEAFYPTSLVTHGQALNITVHGYADTMGFGFIGCRDTLPSMQRLAVYAGEALAELKSIYLGEQGESEPPKKTTAQRRKRPARRRSQA